MGGVDPLIMEKSPFFCLIFSILFSVPGVFCEEHDGDDEEHGEHGGFQVFHVEWERVEVPYAIGLWIILTALVKVGFHKATWINKFFPESSILIICGILIGLFFFFVREDAALPKTLTPDIFFLFLLPPIIGEAGYFMPNRLFFDQLGTILLMAVVGTIFNMFTIGIALWGIGQTGVFFESEAEELGLLETFLF